MTAGSEDTGIDQVLGPRRVQGIVPSAHARLIVRVDTPRRLAASATEISPIIVFHPPFMFCILSSRIYHS